MICRTAVFIFVSICVSIVDAGETLVHDVGEFDAAVKKAEPGDAVVLADGEWRDAELEFRGTGTQERPITLRAQTLGGAVLVGASKLRIGGKHLVVRGLLWKDSAAAGDVIALRIDSKQPAEHCTLAECAILGDAPDKQRKWVSVYGTANVVEHCRFEGKQSGGTLLVVWLEEGAPVNGHHVRYNFFGARERLGKNGGEIIRIGDSDTSLQTSGSTVWKNYFYRCDGEAEIISNKSCGNRYVENVFVGCSGALTLRHGNDAEVLDNQFFGDGRNGTGGVRVIGENHRIVGNLFHQLTGDKTRAAVSLMNGLVDSPLNGYFQVKQARIERNTFIECKETIDLGLCDDDRTDQTLPPVDCRFTKNIVVSTQRPVFVVRHAPLKMTSEGNSFAGDDLGLDAASGWERSTAAAKFDPSTIRLRVIPSDVGPTWMRPGDEYLPEVLKKK